jgi:hypothetical protein
MRGGVERSLSERLLSERLLSERSIPEYYTSLSLKIKG